MVDPSGLDDNLTHYALGVVADWLHTSVGGIAPLEPGWRTIQVRPIPGGYITSAAVSLAGPYGRVACDWSLEKGRFKMRLEVPPSCSADDLLPTSVQSWERKSGVGFVVQSSSHEFECLYHAEKWPPAPLVTAYLPMPPDTIAE